MVSLKYSEKGRAFIDLGTFGRLIFSEMTVTEKGYKYMAYVRHYTKNVAVKGSGGGRNFKEVEQYESHVFNMHLKRNEKGSQGVPHGTIPRPLVKRLLKIFRPLLVENTFLPKSKLDELGVKLEHIAEV
jgi:hypothetical protein